MAFLGGLGKWLMKDNSAAPKFLDKARQLGQAFYDEAAKADTKLFKTGKTPAESLPDVKKKYGVSIKQLDIPDDNYLDEKYSELLSAKLDDGTEYGIGLMTPDELLRQIDKTDKAGRGTKAHKLGLIGRTYSDQKDTPLYLVDALGSEVGSGSGQKIYPAIQDAMALRGIPNITDSFTISNIGRWPQNALGSYLRRGKPGEAYEEFLLNPELFEYTRHLAPESTMHAFSKRPAEEQLGLLLTNWAARHHYTEPNLANFSPKDFEGGLNALRKEGTIIGPRTLKTLSIVDDVFKGREPDRSLFEDLSMKRGGLVALRDSRCQ